PRRGARTSAGAGGQRGHAAAPAQGDQAHARVEGEAARDEEPAIAGEGGALEDRRVTAVRAATMVRMAKDKSIYTCTEGGGPSPKWLGRCAGCGAWNTLVESVADAPARNRFQSLAKTQPVATLSEIEASDVDRQPTGIEELDRALGGGIVAGGVVLIGGDPGIGKSTLLLQALDQPARQLPT